MEGYSSVHPAAVVVREASGLYGPFCRTLIKFYFEFTVLSFELGISLLQKNTTPRPTVDLVVRRSFIQGISK